MKIRTLIPIVALAGVGVATALTGSTASAATPTYTQAGTYAFAASSNTVTASNEFSNSPLSYSDASQTLGANGVTLTVTGSADAGIVVPLGRLDSLFNTDGKFVPPVIVGTNLEGYNLYFDTNASDTFLGFPGGSSVFLDKGSADTPAYDGTNKASMGAINNTNDAATFDTVWSNQNSSVIPAGTGTITMEQVRQDFATNPNGDTNPLVWAWIGMGDGVTTGTATITSVDGTDLVTTTPATTPAVAPSGAGDVINKYLNGLDVYRQVPAVNNKVIVFPVTSTDPAVQFAIVTLPHGFAIEYAPHGVPTGLCVSEAVGSEPSWSAKTGLILRGCFTAWETFNIKDAGNGSFQLVNRATGDVIQPNGTRSQFTGVASSTAAGSYFGWNVAGVVPAS